MRRAQLAFVFVLFALSLATLAQQQTPFPDRDPQAVALLNQAIAAAGGAQAFNAVQDFTATGNITYFWTEKGEQGAVTVKSRGSDQFRLDATLAEGVRSAIVNNGVARIRESDGSVTQLVNAHTDNAGSLYFPYAEIVDSLADKFVGITDLGMVTENGQTARGIRLQKTFPGRDDSAGTRAKMNQRDFFIDP